MGGLTGTEIWERMGVDYSTVSQERKRLRETLKRDKNLLRIIETIEANLSIRNRLSENEIVTTDTYPILFIHKYIVNSIVLAV